MILARLLTRLPQLSLRPQQHRRIITLAIESSCDDSAVAILKTRQDDTDRFKDQRYYTEISFNEKATANNNEFGGIHPLVSLASHQKRLSRLVQRSLHYLPPATHEDIINGLAISMPPSAQLNHIQDRKRERLPPANMVWKRKPDFISATRGPGMLSNLSVGLNLAKGLAVAWGIPLVGVNHLHAHLLTPRLENSCKTSVQTHHSSSRANIAVTPDFPFVSLLVSGGHTAIILSRSIYVHSQIAETCDIAVGDCLDKIARAVLPPGTLQQRNPNQAPAACLTEFALGKEGFAHWERSYEPQKTHAGLLQRRAHPRYGWSLVPPLSESKGGTRRDALEFSFSGIVSSVERLINFEWDAQANGPSKALRSDGEISNDERRAIALEAMRVVFEHLTSRLLLGLEFVTDAQWLYESIGQMRSSDDLKRCVGALKRLIMKRNPGLNLDVDCNDDPSRDIAELEPSSLHFIEFRAWALLRKKMKSFNLSEKSSVGDHRPPAPRTLVVSGGVAANDCLSHVLRSNLRARGFDMELIRPRPALCTDNAAMIAWAGCEMYQKGWTTSLTATPLRKWWLDEPSGASECLVDETPQMNQGGLEWDKTEIKGLMEAPGWIPTLIPPQEQET